MFTHGFVFLSPLFGDTNLCFAFGCPAIGNKKHDVKKQQQYNLRLELHFFHIPMVIYTSVWCGLGNHGEWWSLTLNANETKGILMTQNIILFSLYLFPLLSLLIKWYFLPQLQFTIFFFYLRANEESHFIFIISWICFGIIRHQFLQ